MPWGTVQVSLNGARLGGREVILAGVGLAEKTAVHLASSTGAGLGRRPGDRSAIPRRKKAPQHFSATRKNAEIRRNLMKHRLSAPKSAEIR